MTEAALHLTRRTLSPVDHDCRRHRQQSLPLKRENTLFALVVFELGNVWYCVCTCVFSKFEFFFFAKIECGLYFLNRFDVLMSKMILKK
jgi:hypothetical protein